MSGAAQQTQAVARRATKDTVAKWLGSERMQEFIRRALPSNIDPARLLQIYYNVISARPELQDCTAESLLKVLIFGSQLGLSFDPALKQAWIVPFADRNAGVTNATLIIGYKGLELLALDSGYIDAIDYRPVFKSDVFDYEEGARPKLVHKPDFASKRDESTLMGVYVRGWRGGEVIRYQFVPKADIERHRQASPAVRGGAKTPWDDWYVEMAGKTGVRILAGSMPQSKESIKLHRAIAADVTAEVAPDRQTRELLVEGFEDVIDVEVVKDGETKVETSPATKADKMAERLEKGKKAKAAPKEEAPAQESAAAAAEPTPAPDAPTDPQSPSNQAERITRAGILYDRVKEHVGSSRAKLELFLSEATGGKVQAWRPELLTDEALGQIAGKLEAAIAAEKEAEA